MLRLTRLQRWVPRYFNAAQSQKARPATATSAPTGGTRTNRVRKNAARRASSSADAVTRDHSRTVTSSAALLSDEDADRVAALAPTLQRVSKALSNLEQHSDLRSQDGVLATSFAVKRDVLGPLSLLLPSPPQRLRLQAPPQSAPSHSTSSSTPSGPRRSRLRIVPDAEAGGALPMQSSPRLPSTPGDTKRSILALEDAVLVLMLYSAVESEDGVLLQQILGEVDRFLSENVSAIASAPPYGASPLVKLPLPALLLALSQVGIAVESTLDKIIRRPLAGLTPGTNTANNDINSKSRTPPTRNGGVLYAQLPLYDVNELLQLIAGLHRFGFHQHYAFERTVKELQVRWQRPRSPSVQRARKAIKRFSKGGAQGEVNNNLFHDSERVDDGLQMLLADAGLPDALRVGDARLLVEALTALSLSVFRRPDTISCVADVFILNALDALNAHDLSAEARHQLSQQLHRAVQLCEGMEAEQPLLAEVFGLACSAADKGILFDGGEDTDDVPTEKRAYYDHVTADLVKVNHL